MSPTIIDYGAIYSSVLMALGLLTFVGFRENASDKLSMTILSAGLFISGVMTSIIVKGPVFYLAVLMIPYITPSIVAIVTMLNMNRREILLSAPTALVIGGVLGLLVGNELSFTVSLITMTLILFVVKLQAINKFWSTAAFALLLVFVSVSFLLPASLLLIIIIVDLFSALVFYVLFDIKKGIEVEYKTFEVSRKLTHLLAFLILIPFIWADEIVIMLRSSLAGIDPSLAASITTSNFLNYVVIIVGITAIPIFLLVEYVRISKNAVIIPPELLREHEKDSIAAYIYTLAGVFIVALLFNQVILITATLVGLIADAAAAIVGVYYGRHKITPKRSLEGTLAGFVTAFIITVLVTGNVVAGLLVGLGVELFDVLNVKEINDNIVYPLITAIILSFIL